MKYVLTIGSLLVLTGCDMTANQKCQFRNGMRAFVGQEIHACMSDPVNYCKEICKDHLNTNIRIQTEGGLFSCSCDDR